MTESFDQQAGHSPSSPTGSRQAGQSRDSATSTTKPRLARRTAAKRIKQPVRIAPAVMSPCMAARYRSFAPVSTSLSFRPSERSDRGPESMTTDERLMASGSLVFDRQLLRARRLRAAALGPSTFLIERVAEELSDRLAAVLRRFECTVDLGTPTDAVRRVLAGSGKVGTIIAADALAGVAPFSLPRSPGRAGELAVAADEEALPFRDGSLDLVVSALALELVNDLPGTLIQIRRALKPDGLLLAALAGGDTLTELRQAFAAAEAEIEDGISPRVAPFADVRELGALLQRAGFALPVTDVDRLTVRYASPIALMHDLRRMVATNPLVDRRRRPLKRALLARMMEIYGARFSDPDGRIRATFEIVWLSGWAPHASQQKPLAPGSARHRLADALGVREIRVPGDRGQ